MPFADVNGQNIHYQDTGGDGPAILLSHGFGMGHEMWVHQIEPLTGAGWRVVTYDERGWGQTTHTEPFDYWGLAADVLGVPSVVIARTTWASSGLSSEACPRVASSP